MIDSMQNSSSAANNQMLRHVRAVTAFVLLGLIIGLIFPDPPRANAGQAESRPIAAAPREESEYLGVRRCVLCHDRKSRSSQLDATDKEFGFVDFVTLTEFHTWNDKDQHARAYRVLEENLGKQMGRVLGYDVTKSERCLVCHAIWGKDYRPSAQELRLGVSCEACHGPSSRWFIPHMDPPWRARSSQEKESLGMVDVRNPVNRARQCYSCHLGSAGEGKIVTHAMYAAGHPPLFGLEIGTLLGKVPAHWTPIGQKSDAIKKLLQYNPNEKSRTKSVALGGAVALREAVVTFATRAAAGRQESPEPDFADYNCSACHHDLKKLSWRQRRGYRYAPGYPDLREWPEALVKIAIFQASQDNASYQEQKREFRQKLLRFHDAINSRPFGDPGRIGSPNDSRTASGELIAWLDRLILRLASSRYDQPATVRLLQKLSGPADPDDSPYDAYPDFDSARQVAWAMIHAYGDLEPKPAKDSEINLAFKRLSDALHLEFQAEGAKTSGATETSSAKTLKAALGYDPQWFRQQLQILSELLPR